MYKLNTFKTKELLRFLVGGGSAVVTDYILYRLLIFAGLNLSVSKAISFICGAAVGFVINKLWTFESKKFSKGEILRYVILYAVTAAINALVNKGVLILFDISILAFLCATGVSTVLNFLGQKFFVFRKEVKDEAVDNHSVL
jgi:putative flippase GtrA